MRKSLRSMIAQLRCGILPLRIETGRFTHTELEDRLCLFCDRNDIETEKHSLFDCPLYVNERSTLYQTASKSCQDLLQLDNDDKLKILFTNENVIKHTGIFIKQSMAKRSSILYM